MTLIYKKWRNKLNINKCSLVDSVFHNTGPTGTGNCKRPRIILVGPTCVYGIFFSITDTSLAQEDKKFGKEKKMIWQMHFIFQVAYDLINNSSLSICLLRIILSVVLMVDESGYWANKIPTASQMKCPKFILRRLKKKKWLRAVQQKEGANIW